MTREKLKRVVTGLTVAGTLVVVFLLIIIVYQVVHICVLSHREKVYNEEIERLEQIQEEKEGELEYWSADEAKEILAYQNGFRQQGDK